jgi:hypothetical protein
MESAIIQKLLAAGGKCADFLGNKQKRILPVTGETVVAEVEGASLFSGLGGEFVI